MENLTALLIPLILLGILIRVMLLPIRLLWKLLINSGCGFLCLWLLNWISGYTGVTFPINAVTAATAGFLGLPGIVLLALTQWML